MTDDKPTYDELLTEIANLKKQLSDKPKFGFCDRHQQFEKELIAQSEIIDSTIDLIWSVDKDNFGLLTFNKSLYNYFYNGRNIKIKVGDRPEYLLPTDEYAQIWHNFYKKALDEGSYTCEYTVFNNTRTLELNFNLLEHNNIVFGISVFGRDITLIKQNEIELISAKNKAETERQQQKALIEHAIIPVLITTAQGKVIYLNKACYDFFVFPPDIDLGTIHPLDYWVFPENRALYVKQIQEKGAALNFENYLINTKKEVKTVLQSASFIKYNDEMCLFSIIYDITERKALENELINAKEKAEESDEKHRALLDTMFEGVTLNELIFNEQGEVIDYRILEANASFEKHSNIKRHDVAGKLATEIYQMNSDYIKEFWRINLKNNKLITTDYHVEQTGSWTRVKTSPVKNNKFTITLFDFTEQKKAEELVKQKSEEIELQNSRLESLLKITQLQTNSIQELLDFALNEAIILTASKIGYIYFYDEVKRQFILNTWSKDVMQECKVMNPQTIYELDKTGCWGEAVRQRKPIVINEYQAENQYKKGTPHGHVALKKFLTIPVIFEDKIVAVCGVANKETDYDNSDIRQLSLLMDSVWKISERIILIKDLIKAKEKAEESDRLKSSFLQNMSHEVRTPLNAIAGFSQLMSKPNQSPEKLKKFSEMVVENSDKLIGIITDVIEISQIHSKITKSKLSEFDIILLLNDIVNKFKIKTIEKNIELQTEINIPFQEYFIQSDKEKLQRILFHLIDNAIKFTANGFVKIICELENGNIKFSIIDTGIGISDEMQKVIFEPFRQVETGICRNFGGNGLGLSLAKAYTELLNGSITLNSEINKGTTFSISIPTNKTFLQTNEILQENKIYSINTILIAEDEYSNYQYLLALLEETNLQILYAANGQQAVDLCRANSAIDLILMDIKMPIMDGHTAAKLIKGFRSDLPIIAQTAYALESEREAFIGIFDDYISKPISEEILNQKLMKYIGK